jgi:hypothetical protein
VVAVVAGLGVPSWKVKNGRNIITKNVDH